MPYGFDPERPRLQPGVAEADDLLPDAFRLLAPVHGDGHYTSNRSAKISHKCGINFVSRLEYRPANEIQATTKEVSRCRRKRTRRWCAGSWRSSGTRGTRLLR